MLYRLDKYQTFVHCFTMKDGSTKGFIVRQGDILFIISKNETLTTYLSMDGEIGFLELDIEKCDSFSRIN